MFNDSLCGEVGFWCWRCCVWWCIQKTGFSSFSFTLLFEQLYHFVPVISCRIPCFFLHFPETNFHLRTAEYFKRMSFQGISWPSYWCFYWLESLSSVMNVCFARAFLLLSLFLSGIYCYFSCKIKCLFLDLIILLLHFIHWIFYLLLCILVWIASKLLKPPES